MLNVHISYSAAGLQWMLSDERSRADFTKFGLGDPDQMISQKKDFSFNIDSVHIWSGVYLQTLGIRCWSLRMWRCQSGSLLTSRQMFTSTTFSSGMLSNKILAIRDAIQEKPLPLQWHLPIKSTYILLSLANWNSVKKFQILWIHVKCLQICLSLWFIIWCSTTLKCKVLKHREETAQQRSIGSFTVLEETREREKCEWRRESLERER